MSLKNLSVKIKIHKFYKDKLKDQRISNIYNKFEKSLNIIKSFAVAVSGGPDSLALAFLAKVYSMKHKVKIKFFIVDHKLRPESTNEAKNIKKLLKKFMIDLEILTWKGLKPSSNIQSVAREKRYELLFRRCDKYEIKSILLGHHQDDLFENFFIRMLRGSGLKGLISLDIKNKIGNKNLLRPLLELRREDLVYLTKKTFGHFVKDPSNDDIKYKRIKIRNLIDKLKKEGLDDKKFANTIKNLKRSNKVVNFYTDENLKNNSFYFQDDNKFVLNDEFFNQPHEIVFRGLSKLIKLIGQKYYSVRGKKLNHIIQYVKNNQKFRVTLGGCVIEKVNLSIIISKEH